MSDEPIQVPLEELIEEWSKDPYMLLELDNLYMMKELTGLPILAYKTEDNVYYWLTNLKGYKVE